MKTASARDSLKALHWLMVSLVCAGGLFLGVACMSQPAYGAAENVEYLYVVMADDYDLPYVEQEYEGQAPIYYYVNNIGGHSTIRKPMGASFDGDTNTLTLENGFKAQEIHYLGEADLIVQVNGTVTITGNSFIIAPDSIDYDEVGYEGGDITIRGKGQKGSALKINGGVISMGSFSSSVYAYDQIDGDIRIRDITIVAGNGVLACFSDVVLNRATLRVCATDSSYFPYGIVTGVSENGITSEKGSIRIINGSILTVKSAANMTCEPFISGRNLLLGKNENFYAGATLKTLRTCSTKAPTSVVSGMKKWSGQRNFLVTPNRCKVLQSMIVKGKTAQVAYSAAKAHMIALTVDKVLTVKKAHGIVTYTKMNGNNRIVIDKYSGKVKVKKGLKKGLYKVKVRVNAMGNKYYYPAKKTAIFRIKVA